MRFNFETALGIKSTEETSQTEDYPWLRWRRQDIRKLEVTQAGRFGAVWFGQGSMATDGAAEIDNSGTSVAGYVNLAHTAGSFEFRDGDALSGITVGQVFKDFDRPRRFRIRYDTPDMAGLVVSAAYGRDVLVESDNADYYDIALRYGYKGATFHLDAAMGYNWKSSDAAPTDQGAEVRTIGCNRRVPVDSGGLKRVCLRPTPTPDEPGKTPRRFSAPFARS